MLVTCEVEPVFLVLYRLAGECAELDLRARLQSLPGAVGFLLLIGGVQLAPLIWAFRRRRRRRLRTSTPARERRV